MYTELEAINYILSQVGASPVSVIDNVRPDLVQAQIRLHEASVDVQKRGWWFNKIINIELSPQPDGYQDEKKILLPENTMKIMGDYPQFYVENDGYAYDPIANTFEFEDSICVDIVLLQDWTSLPGSVQDAIRLKAAASMVQHDLEDMNKYNTIMAEYQMAYVLLKTEDLEIKQRHSYSTPAVSRFMRRVRPYKRRSGTYDPRWPGGRSV